MKKKRKIELEDVSHWMDSFGFPIAVILMAVGLVLNVIL